MMKTEQFKRCTEKLVQEYERSKGKHPDFDSVDRAWRAIQREYSEVVNESLRDTIKPEALAEEMLHLANVALQGYMFLTEEKVVYFSTPRGGKSWMQEAFLNAKDKSVSQLSKWEKWAKEIEENSNANLREMIGKNFRFFGTEDGMALLDVSGCTIRVPINRFQEIIKKKENKAMNKESWNGIIEACQALRDGKKAQCFHNEKWEDDDCDSKGRITFFPSCQYRAKPEPKLRALTPQEWFDALMDGKKLADGKRFLLRVGNNTNELYIDVEDSEDFEECMTSEEMLSSGRKFSDGSPCGVEVAE